MPGDLPRVGLGTCFDTDREFRIIDREYAPWN